MTDSGQRILPGADLGREVPLPPQPPLEDDFPCCVPREAVAAFEATYGYPADARYAAETALIAAGLVDPDDGTIPRWPRGETTPLWTNPMHVVDTVLKAALPHLRSLQVETQVEVGRLLGRKEAAEEIAKSLDRQGNAHLEAAADTTKPGEEDRWKHVGMASAYQRATLIALSVGQPTTTEGA